MVDVRTLVVVSAVVMAYAAFAGPMRRSPFTAPLVFAGVGFLLSRDGLGWLDGSISPAVLNAVTTLTLVVVLFSDAAQLELGSLRREVGIPLRLLAIGLPLTIMAGVAVGLGLLPALAPVEVVILAVILAPTDAALGQAVVTDTRLPSRIRQGLNTESGLNDGICVPILAMALAAAEVSEAGAASERVLRELLKEIGLGAAAGVVAGVAGGYLLRLAVARGWTTALWKPLVAVGAAGLAYGLALDWGASGFIAAFVGGLTLRVVRGVHAEEEVVLAEELSQLLGAATFLLFGAAVLPVVLHDVGWRSVAYAVASLTVIRMVPVALALLGSGLSRPAVWLAGWFGPRGLASIVFALVAVQTVQLPHADLIVQVASITIALSVVAHGVTANPLVERYVGWEAQQA